MNSTLATVNALVFDVFGTVVDWRSTIMREGRALGLDVDWARFADAWRRGYAPALERVNCGQLPWQNLDALHRMILDDIVLQFAIDLTEAQKVQLNRVWHRLQPWPDAVAGLQRLRARFIIAPLSNGHFALLTNMAKHAQLPWDCILSAELAGRYKPHRSVYEMAAKLLDLRPDQVMMVAAHTDDLHAARAVGLRTAFVARPQEWGEPGTYALPSASSFDLIAGDFNDLASQLAAS